MPDLLLEQSAPLRSAFFEKHAELLETLVEQGQSPQGLLITCSDSRVSPERLLGSAPGDLFMLRNIANLVPPFEQQDTAITAVLEYAIRHLHVPHIVICGHTDCGGIKGLDAQIDPKAEPALANWIEFARPAQRKVDTKGKMDDWPRHRAIVEQNVVQQLRHIQSYPFVLEALEANLIELHGWVYHMRRRLMSYYDSVRDEFDILETAGM